jgi:hypothetical protein
VAVFWFDLDIIIALTDIKGHEECLALKLFKDMGNLGYRVYVVDSPLIDLTVVLYWSECAILLFNKEEGGRIWGVRWLNVAHSLVFIQELFCCLHFWSR